MTWWKNLRRVTIKKSYYKCSCPKCQVPFTVPEDLPEHKESWFGIDVFIAYCPICGQKLRFSIDDTPATPTPLFFGNSEKIEKSNGK